MEQTIEELLNEMAESLSSPGIDPKKYRVLCDASNGLCRTKLKVGIQRAYPVSQQLLGSSFAHLANQTVKVGDESGPYFGYGSVAKIDSIDRKRKAVTFVASTGSTDRMGDIIEQDGILLKNYKRNPVHLFAHDSRGLPIGVGPKIRVDGDRLIQEVRYTPVAGFDFPQVIFELILAGTLRGISIGFLPLEFTFLKEGQGRRFTKIELLETSTVPIPANPEALVTGKSFSIGEALHSLSDNPESSGEEIWQALAAYADRTDPEVERAATAILRGDEKTIAQFCEVIISHLKNVHPTWISKIRFGLAYGGRQRLLTLAEIFVSRLGTDQAQELARTLFGAISCPECSREQKQSRCSCGCARYLCSGCRDLDQTTEMILRELARSA